MTSGWHWLVVVLTVGNMAALWWLMSWSATQGDPSKGDDETLDHVWDGDLRERNQPLPRWWLVMFQVTIVFSIGYLAMYPGLGNFAGSLGWTQEIQYQRESDAADEIYAATFSRLSRMSWLELSASEEARRIGANLFAGNCALCHGSDGGGAPGFPSLKDDDWLYGNDHEAIETSIREGRSGLMTAMGPALAGMGVSVADMVEKVKAVSGREHDAEASARADVAWPLCMACHGADGAGNPALGAPDLTDDIWLYGGSDEALTRTIESGRNGKMPANAELLTDDQIRVLAAFVRGLSQG